MAKRNQTQPIPCRRSFRVSAYSEGYRLCLLSEKPEFHAERFGARIQPAEAVWPLPLVVVGQDDRHLFHLVVFISGEDGAGGQLRSGALHFPGETGFLRDIDPLRRGAGRHFEDQRRPMVSAAVLKGGALRGEVGGLLFRRRVGIAVRVPPGFLDDGCADLDPAESEGSEEEPNEADSLPATLLRHATILTVEVAQLTRACRVRGDT